MFLKKFQIFLLILIAVLVGYGIGVTKVNLGWKNYKPSLSIINKEPPASLGTVDLAQFWAVWDRVSSMYYDKTAIDPQKMLNGAISGMVASLQDPYTMYLPPVQNNNFQQQLAGKFEGIGAELSTNKDKAVIVVAPIAGSPAEKAGIKAGDMILKVDGKAIDALALPQVVEKIRGPKGTTVVLSILHKGDQKITDISIIRDTITVKSITGYVKSIKDIPNVNVSAFAHPDTKVTYLRLSQFGDATNQDWLTLITQLAPDVKSSRGVILDLRNNPGGYLKDAVFIAGEFLKVGTPVVIQDAGNGDKATLAVDRQGKLLTEPIVVLVNGGSASASEIVAGALRDYKRAILVGEQSFGKGTIQEALDLSQGAGLHVTVAKWLTPNGTWVHGTGLTPDVKVVFDSTQPDHDVQLEKAIEQLVQ